MTTYVLGLGNVLMGDDGFGPRVARAFDAEFDAGDGVEVVDLGTPGLDLMPWFYDADQLLIVDTVKSDGVPGSLRLYGRTEILTHTPSVRVGPHDPGVKEALLTLEFAGRGPRDVLLVGAVPGAIGMSTELSPPLAAAVPRAVAALAEALARLGHPVRRRAAADASRPWWCEASA